MTAKLVFVGVAALTACAADDGVAIDGENDTFVSTDGKSDSGEVSGLNAVGVTVRALLNQSPVYGEGTSLETYLDSLPLADIVKSNIIQRRIGDDLVEGTDDDRTFASILEIDDIAWVGPRVFRILATAAKEHSLYTDAVASGSIVGVIGYPSEGLPSMRIYAIRPDGSAYHRVERRGGAGFTTVQVDFLEPGPWQLVGYTAPPLMVAGGYTQFSLCGLQASCGSHELITMNLSARGEGAVNLGGGEIAVAYAQLTDWYATDAFPPEPMP
jgi:hypothetical protein